MGPGHVLKILFVKNNKIANSSTTTEAIEKNKHRFEIMIVLGIF